MNEEKIKCCKSVKKHNPALDNMSVAILSAMTIAVRKAVKENRQLRRKQTARRIPAADKGLTLIELLIVISIMVMLVAVSVPMFKPMFESQRTKIAAQTVAAAFQRVRFKAMEENASCGIQFVPYEQNNTVALQMRLVKQAGSYINDADVRVRVVDGNISFYKYASNAWNYDASISDSKFIQGAKIQFGRQGKLYTLDSPTKLKEEITLPENSDTDAMEYRIISPPRPVLTSPVVLPRGTVVDLKFSDGKNGKKDDGTDTLVELRPTDEPHYINPEFLYYHPNIVFTPSGYVDYFNGNYKPFYGGLIYVCIGEWDRQCDAVSGDTLAEDGKNNIQTLTNYWVTLNPLTGQVRITPMAPASDKTDLTGARKFAAEHWGISE